MIEIRVWRGPRQRNGISIMFITVSRLYNTNNMTGRINLLKVNLVNGKKLQSFKVYFVRNDVYTWCFILMIFNVILFIVTVYFFFSWDSMVFPFFAALCSITWDSLLGNDHILFVFYVSIVRPHTFSLCAFAETAREHFINTAISLVFST